MTSEQKTAAHNLKGNYRIIDLDIEDDGTLLIDAEWEKQGTPVQIIIERDGSTHINKR